MRVIKKIPEYSLPSVNFDFVNKNIKKYPVIGIISRWFRYRDINLWTDPDVSPAVIGQTQAHVKIDLDRLI